jgi:hypothetical protein
MEDGHVEALMYGILAEFKMMMNEDGIGLFSNEYV